MQFGKAHKGPSTVCTCIHIYIYQIGDTVYTYIGVYRCVYIYGCMVFHEIEHLP